MIQAKINLKIKGVLTIIIQHLLPHSQGRIIEECDIPLMILILRIMHQYIVLSSRNVDSSLLVRGTSIVVGILENLRFVETYERMRGEM